jgi:hypothetical protein
VLWHVAPFRSLMGDQKQVGDTGSGVADVVQARTVRSAPRAQVAVVAARDEDMGRDEHQRAHGEWVTRQPPADLQRRRVHADDRPVVARNSHKHSGP